MRRASIPAYHKAIRNNRTQLVNLGTSSELEIAVWESLPLERSVMLAIRDAFNRIAQYRFGPSRTRSAATSHPRNFPRSCGKGVLTFCRRLWHLVLDRRCRTNVLHILYVSSQDFSHTPGLRDASARPLWCVTIEDLRDVSKSAIGEMTFQRFEPFGGLAARGIATSVNLYMCGDEWA
jgi:hypothetical protein